MGWGPGGGCADGEGGAGCGGCALAGTEGAELVGEGVVLDCVGGFLLWGPRGRGGGGLRLCSDIVFGVGVWDLHNLWA